MSDTKQWLSPTEVEVTKTVTITETVSLSSLESNCEILTRTIAELEKDLVLKQEALARCKEEIAELESLPNRPDEPAIIDPLFVAEKPAE